MELIQSKAKEMYFSAPELYDFDKPILIVELTNKKEHAIPDLKVAKWVDDLIQSLEEKSKEASVLPIQERISISNILVLELLRLRFKEKKLSNIIMEHNGVQYDIIFPNGKMEGNLFNNDHFFSRFENICYKLL